MSTTQGNAAKAQHTPLPWQIIESDENPGDKTWIWSPGTETTVCSCWDGVSNGQRIEEAEANAELISRAVNAHHDLLAALQGIVTTAKGLLESKGQALNHALWEASMAKSLKACSAAIARATGQEGER